MSFVEIPAAAFLPFHLANVHCLARVMPFKAVSYPVMMLMGVAQFLLEHMPEMMVPYGCGILLAPLTGMFFVALVAFFVLAYQKSTQKTFPLASIAWVIVQSVVFLGLLQVPPPPDTLEAAGMALKDEHYVKYHLLGHALLPLALALGSWDVPWSEPTKNNGVKAE